MLTKAQQDHMDDVIARVGKPSPALQFKIDQLRAAKTEGEVMTVLTNDADIVRSEIETELLCLVAITKQLEIKEQHKTPIYEEMERVEKEKAGRPTVLLKKAPAPQTKQIGYINLMKAVGIVALIFFGAVALLSAMFDRKHSGQPIEYTIIYTTINGQYYEKEETAEDLNGSGYVTFSDGTRVSWTAVKTKKASFYPDELGKK